MKGRQEVEEEKVEHRAFSPSSGSPERVKLQEKNEPTEAGQGEVAQKLRLLGVPLEAPTAPSPRRPQSETSLDA